MIESGGLETYMAVTGPGRNAGRGESGLSEKGEKAEMRALVDDGGLNGERTAIIMATHATGECWDEGFVGNETTSRRRDFRRCHATCAAGEQRWRYPPLLRLIDEQSNTILLRGSCSRTCMFGSTTARQECDLNIGRCLSAPTPGEES